MKKALSKLIFVVFMLLSIVGTILYFIGKAIKALGYLMKGYTGSAKREVKDFISFTYDVSDL